MMRRTILVLAAIALMLAMVGTPAGAYPKSYPEWDTLCDMDRDGVRETQTTQVGSFQPGWTIAPVPVNAPAIYFGGQVWVWRDSVLTVDGEVFVPPPGMEPRLIDCRQESTYMSGSGVKVRVLWDPILLFFPPPAVPPSSPPSSE